MAAEAGLSLIGLTKRFVNHVAVNDLSLEIPPGSVLALLGPSGSGKTTTLRLIAGFETPDKGHIRIGAEDVTTLTPAQRRFGMVFQHYALFPHLTVGENVAFGLEKSLSKQDRLEIVVESLRLVDLAGFEERKIDELSGGQQQRVAVARAVAPGPRVMLFDEPLSNLDPSLRERTRRELRAAIDRVGVTTVFVTHEQEEAFALGDVVAVLNDGVLEQVGEPIELYENPLTHFVATFVGRASSLKGEMVAPDRVKLSDGCEWPVRSPVALEAGQPVMVAVRPEALRPAGEGETGLSGKVVERRFTGGSAFFEVETELGLVEFEANVHTAHVGDMVSLVAEFAHAFPMER